MKKASGITLIALIITIIVLLILAGVALATLTGQGNIIGNAENAVGKYNNSITDEQELLSSLEKQLNKFVNNNEQTNPVYAVLYKISDEEYHLIFNSTGDLSEGYTQEQFVCKSRDISNGCEYESRKRGMVRVCR